MTSVFLFCAFCAFLRLISVFGALPKVNGLVCRLLSILYTAGPGRRPAASHSSEDVNVFIIVTL
jgi:hypothetical protein